MLFKFMFNMIPKFLIILLVSSLSYQILLFGQEGGNVTLEELKPGNLSANILFYTPWFFGLDSELEPEMKYLPDLVGSDYRTKINYDFLPVPLQVDPFEIYEQFIGTTTYNLNELIGLSSPTIPMPRTSFLGGQKSGIVGVGITTRSKFFMIGAGYRELFSFTGNTMLTGTDTLISVTNPEGVYKLRLQPTIRLNSLVQIVRYDLRLGLYLTDIFEPYIVGNYYEGYMKMNFNVLTDAIVTLPDNSTVEFNTDDHNRLDQSVNGSCKASSIGGKVGTVIYLEETRLAIRTTFEKALPLKFNGSFVSLIHYIDPEQFNSADPTATVTSSGTITNPLTVDLPSAVSAEASFFFNPVIISGGYRKYLSDLKFSGPYLNQLIKFNYSIYVNITLPFPLIQLSGGVVYSDTIPLPLFSVGTELSLGKNWQLEESFIALPLQILKTRISYRF